MSTLLKKMFEEIFEGKKRRLVKGQAHCALCRGELYPGDHYYHLDGMQVCEACLERYAQQYFSSQRRRLPASEKEDR